MPPEQALLVAYFVSDTFEIRNPNIGFLSFGSTADHFSFSKVLRWKSFEILFDLLKHWIKFRKR